MSALFLGNKMKKAYLILADGTVFEGESIGADGSTIGETVFTTGMTGYLETLTDPSYFGQIVTQTFPLIGNYGVIPEDFESKKSFVRGYVVRELCNRPSNFREDGRLDAFLKQQGIVGICGIDTRRLTKILREAGVMNGMIVSANDAKLAINNGVVVEEILEKIRAYKIENAVKSVQDAGINTKEGKAFPTLQPPAAFSATPSSGGIPRNAPMSLLENSSANRETSSDKLSTLNFQFSVVLWDFGAKENIPRELEKRGLKVTRVPCTATAEEILALNPDGIMLSNGPGDPAENVQIIEELKKICEWNKKVVSTCLPTGRQGSTTASIPIFGICLGHQMLALARGAKTSKLKYGHRGGNHPVKDLETGRVYITSQNHGYAVENDSLPDCAKLRFLNANDGTCEGLDYTDIPAFSVQFHPEACGGPHDTNFLFDRFLEMIKTQRLAMTGYHALGIVAAPLGVLE